MRGIVKLASAMIGRRGLSGMTGEGQQQHQSRPARAGRGMGALSSPWMAALTILAAHAVALGQATTPPTSPQQPAIPPAQQQPPPAAGGTAVQPGQPAQPTTPAPNVVAPGAAPATAPPETGAASLVVSGLDERTGSVRLLVNKSTTLVTARPYKRVNVAQPDIADANPIGTTRILVTGKKAGATQIIIWDEDDNSQQIDVLVQANLLQLRSLYERLLPGSTIDVIDNDGTIALTGQVPNLQTAEQATALASGFGNKVLNLLEVAGGQQVMLQVRFAEVSKTATSALGVNLGFVDTAGAFGASNIGLQQFTLREIEGVSQFAENPPGTSITHFGRALVGSTAIDVFVSALRENNLLRVLAEPNLVATSGQEAEFLAGGDFPVPIVQGGSDSGTSITVEFREFGVRLKFTPVVVGSGRIRLKMAPEVSDVDFTNAVLAQGFRIPGRRTRRLSTTIELNEGETFAVGGLLDNRVAANKAATPLLGDIPVLGALFRSVRYQRQETELVVLVTPRIVSGMQPGQVHKLPGEHWRHPNELGLYLFGDIGDEVKDEDAEKIPARRFIGSYGFVPAP
jgi:pilus assembly protein CpaC